VWAVRGVYLFYVTGSCNGLNQAAFCVFDPKGQNNQVSDLAATCPVKPATEKDLTLSGVDLSGFPVINPSAKDKIVFIGCYSCDYSRKAYPMVMDLVRKTGISFTFLHYPVKEKTDFMSRVGYCTYLQDQNKYWMVNDAFFTMDRADLENETAVRQLVTAAGEDPDKVFACVNDPQTEVTVQKMLDEITKTKFFGTPTVFINGKPLVGPKPYRVYAIMVQGLFYWLK
jgi:protein-disulfide isomerase